VLGYCGDPVISDVLAMVESSFILLLDFGATVLAIAISCINPNDFYIINVIQTKFIVHVVDQFAFMFI
jgi:hypothetical protein